jgi:tetratricopeptide (TPR) repeat protein
VVIVIVFTVLCWSRNEDWENKEMLYAHDIEYIHESAKANMLLGALRAKAAMERRLAARSYKEKGMQYAFDTAYASAKRLFEESRGYYKKATEVAPYYYTAWSNLGTTYFFLETDADTANELTKQALVYFKKSIALKPNYSEGLFNTAMSYERLGDIDSAIYYFNRSISSDSAYFSSYEQLSRIYLQHRNQPDKAMGVLQTAAQKKPDSDAPWNAIGNLYLQLKDTASAAGAFEMAARINPNNPQRLYNLAGYFYKKGNMEKFNYYNGLFKELQEKMQQNGQMPAQQQRRR